MKRYTRDGEGRFKEVEIRDWRLENGFELFQRGFGIRESDSLHAEFFARFDIFRHIVHEHRFFWLDTRFFGDSKDYGEDVTSKLKDA